MLCWDGFLRKTPLENSHFGSSFLHAIFPLPLIMDHTSWNKYWVAFKRQVKTTAISEKEHLAFSLYQELKSQPTGIPETYSIRKLKKKILTSKTLLLNFTARNYFSNYGLKFSATKTYPKYKMCNSISSTFSLCCS